MTPAAKEAGPAARAAFTQFIDYAGLFPPAQLEMAAAVEEYGVIRRGPLAWMSGRFIVPASRIPEFVGELGSGGPAHALSVIVDAGTDARTWLSRVQQMLEELVRACKDDSRLDAQVLEIALPPVQAQRDTYDAAIGQFAAAREHAGLGNVPAFVEVPRDTRWSELLPGALAALGRHRIGAKLRCGGVVREAFPGVDEVAQFLDQATQQHIPFKATAGLHHPVRRPDPVTGATMHGFLNLLTATAFARVGPHDTISRVLACEDATAFALEPDALRFEDRRVSIDDLRAARSESFISYGSCSFEEPSGDLQALGML
jgi:hypothetical protein